MAVKLVKVGSSYNTNIRKYFMDTDAEVSILPVEGVPTFSIAVSGVSGSAWYFATDKTWKVLPVSGGGGGGGTGDVTKQMLEAAVAELREEIQQSKEISVGEDKPTNPNVTLWLDPSEGNEYTIPSISDGVTSDVDTWSSNKIDSEINARIDDMVVISDEYPVTEYNKIWIKKTTQEIEIPSMGDISTLNSKIDDKQDKVIVLTQQEYDDLETKGENTIYLIMEN